MTDAQFLGSHVTSLVFVEVIPVAGADPTISCAFVKRFLTDLGVLAVRQWTTSSKVSGGICRCQVISRQHDHNQSTMSLPTLNPLTTEGCPCVLIGYGTPTEKSVQKVMVTNDTLVRILPADASSMDKVEVQSVSSGELPCPSINETLGEEIRHNHDTETNQALKLRLSMLLSRPISIGSTEQAIRMFKRRRGVSHAMQKHLDAYTGKTSTTSTPSPKKKQRRVDGALTLHSPQHAAGKTLLIQSIAAELECRVHVIEAAPLMAKYGIRSDAALETLFHSVVMSAAVQHERICIVLDHLQAFGPPSTKSMDASLPILTSMASYLATLTKSIQHRGEVPFPSKNPLYNLGGVNGRVLNVNLCVVGVVTCPDGDHKKGPTDVLNLLCGGRYRLPDLTTQGRIRALSRALRDVPLSEAATQQLPSLVASRVGLRGRDFGRVKFHLLQQQKQSRKEASTEDVVAALSSVQQTKPAQYEVVINANGDSATTADPFSSVGGNTEAKVALQDALAMDPKRRQALQAFGMSPPAGVLLFGPPGTGKTLLARAVAKVLSSQTNGMGGAFFSLQASEIVRSEVGNSEKELVLAFETARANAPSVIFIDEFQALFTERSSGSGGQLASTLLHCMDDISHWEEGDKVVGNQSQRVVVMGATNTPWMIDSAFLRAGRFDKVVHVGLPAVADRNSILRVHIQRMRLKDTENELGPLCDMLAKQTDGFSGADLAALCRSAAVRCLRQQGDDGVVDESHFTEALRDDVKATSSRELVDRLIEWRP